MYRGTVDFILALKVSTVKWDKLRKLFTTIDEA